MSVIPKKIFKNLLLSKRINFEGMKNCNKVKQFKKQKGLFSLIRVIRLMKSWT